MTRRHPIDDRRYSGDRRPDATRGVPSRRPKRTPRLAQHTIEAREWRDLEAGGWPQDDALASVRSSGGRESGTPPGQDGAPRRPWAANPFAPAWRPEADDPTALDRSQMDRGDVDRDSTRVPSTDTHADVRIARDVHERLTRDAAVEAAGIEVQVHNGVVTLRGTVPERRQKRRAARGVAGIAGVCEVFDHLRVART